MKDIIALLVDHPFLLTTMSVIATVVLVIWMEYRLTQRRIQQEERINNLGACYDCGRVGYFRRKMITCVSRQDIPAPGVLRICDYCGSENTNPVRTVVEEYIRGHHREVQ